MRKVVLSVAASLDNYIARADDSVDWLFEDGDFGLAAFFDTLDAVLIGRKTHDFMVRFGMPFYPKIRNYVFTHQRGRDDYEGNIEYVSGDLAAFVRELRAQPGKRIWVCGGAEIADPLLQAGLIDEVNIALHPRLLGAGVRLFNSRLPETALRLMRHQVYDNGLVTLDYEIVKETA